MLFAAGVLHNTSTAGTSMLLACPPVPEDTLTAPQRPTPAPLPRLFAFPDPLELHFLASRCQSSARLSIKIRAWLGALAVAAGCLFFALNTLSNRVRCAPLSPAPSSPARACGIQRAPGPPRCSLSHRPLRMKWMSWALLCARWYARPKRPKAGASRACGCACSASA